MTLVLMLLAAYVSIGQRLLIDIQGRILNSRELPKPGNNPNIMVYTEYSIQDGNGPVVSYLTDGSDQYLPRDLPAGSVIKKEKWHLGFQLNGQLVEYPFGSFWAFEFAILVFSIPLYFVMNRAWLKQHPPQ